MELDWNLGILALPFITYETMGNHLNFIFLIYKMDKIYHGVVRGYIDKKHIKCTVQCLANNRGNVFTIITPRKRY